MRWANSALQRSQVSHGRLCQYTVPSVRTVLEHALAERFTVHRWFEMPGPEAVLAPHGPAIRAVITGGHLGIPSELAAQLPGLEIVAINGVGFDKVDLALAKARGFRVTNTPDVLTDDVADLAIGLVVALLRRIPQADRHVRDGRWPEAEVPLARKVSAQRFGVVGLGRIGKAIARRLEGFGVPIAYTDLAPQDVPYSSHPTPTALAHTVDVLIVAAAAGGTRPLIDCAVLDALGPEGVLVNVARGSLVNEAALVTALQEGRLGGAALDVFAVEPHVPQILWSMSNIVLTPHIASATIDTRRAMAECRATIRFAGPPTIIFAGFAERGRTMGKLSWHGVFLK